MIIIILITIAAIIWILASITILRVYLNSWKSVETKKQFKKDLEEDER